MYYVAYTNNKFLDAAFHRFDGGNKQQEVRVIISTVKRGVFLESRWLKTASKIYSDEHCFFVSIDSCFQLFRATSNFLVIH